jgi:hypothetical protein
MVTSAPDRDALVVLDRLGPRVVAPEADPVGGTGPAREERVPA